MPFIVPWDRGGVELHEEDEKESDSRASDKAGGWELLP